MKLKDKLLYTFLGFSIFCLIFIFITLLHLNLKLANEQKDKPNIIKHKDEIIICLKEQIECYRDIKNLEKEKIIETCKDINFCEKY